MSMEIEIQDKLTELEMSQKLLRSELLLRGVRVCQQELSDIIRGKLKTPKAAYVCNMCMQIFKEREEKLRDKVYKNEDKACNCDICELKYDCMYFYKFQRLPSENGGLGLCHKL